MSSLARVAAISFMLGLGAAPTACAVKPSSTVSFKPTPCRDPVLAAASKLRTDKQFDRAQAVVAPLLGNPQTANCAADTAIAIEASRKDSAAGPWTKAFDAFLASAAGIVFSVAVLLAGLLGGGVIVGGIRLASLFRRQNAAPRWRVREIGAGSNPMILAAWRRAMDRSAARLDTNANLLIQSGLPLPRGIVRGGIIDVDTQHVFEGAPAFQGVSLAWLQSIGQFLARRCQSPRRTLTITATAHEKSAIVWIEACDAAAKIRVATAAAVWTGDNDIAEEIDAMAARLALKTNYLIADGATDIGVAELQQMQIGIEKLNAYAQANNPAALKEAVAAFHGAAQLDPETGTGTLYEGIANELLEDHDRAARLFSSIAAALPVKDDAAIVALQATYNFAITDLRRYKPDKVVAAEDTLQKLAEGIASPQAPATAPRNYTVRAPDDEKRRLRAFALAARANALAHYYIFWDRIGVKPAQPAVLTAAELGLKQPELEGWGTTADQLLAEATGEVRRAYFTNDANTAVQLRWLIDNARGNLALNRATCEGPAGVADETAREALLNDALAAFLRCEALVTPGVETLTNIATTLLALEKPTTALDFTRKARALNPRYEYAYMREYEAQAQRGDRFGAHTILVEASETLGMIGIPEFRRHFEDMGVPFHAR